MEKMPSNELTPEKKAELQQSRALSDAELINDGAQFIPDSNGELILNVDTEKGRGSVLVKRESPDAQKLIKLFRNTRPSFFRSPTSGILVVDGDKSSKDLFSYYNYKSEAERGDDTAEGRQIAKTFVEKVTRVEDIGDDYDGPFLVEKKYDKYSVTNVYFRDSENKVPCIVIRRSEMLVGPSRFDENIEFKVELVECGSLEEFYSKLTSEEKEKGEELGRKFEKFLPKEK